jgi:Carboxypeptidase regulatory-like domain
MMTLDTKARRLAEFVALIVLTSAFVVPRTYAQLAGANLSGTVTDPSHSAIPNAKVSITNLATGVTRDVTTNADGLYSAPNLAPGNYQVTVTASGFSTLVRSGITLTVGAEQALDLTLQVGQVSQKIEVAAVAPTVETTSSTLSATVEQTTIVELPLNGRDWTQLATLEPGVIAIHAQASTSSTANRGNRGFGNQLTDSGHRPNENTYRVNGININDYSNGAPGSVLGVNLGVDAIQEFSVVTTNYSAEYGRTSGAVINAITKSGTNTFHGSGYFFDRDKVYDARGYFDNQLPPFRRIQFGGSAGGPIVKDKTFIFGDYEGVRQNQGVTFSDRVPSPAARAGTLCSIPQPGPTGCSTFSLTAPPAGVNPSPNPDSATGIDKAVLPFLALWPSGNGAIVGNGDTQVYTVAGVQNLTENYVTARLDQKFSDSDSANGSYFFDNAPQTIPDALDNVVHEIFTRRQGVTMEESHIFSPELANFVRFGFNRVVGLVNTPIKAINPAAADPALAAIPGQLAPLLGVPGLTSAGGLGNPSFFGHHYNSFQFYDDLFLTRGTHSLKFGFAFERMQYNVLSLVRRNGNFNFGSLTDFLTNRPLNVLLLDPDPQFRRETGSRQSLFGGYVQDDWRVRSNLTLNLGLRYEMLTLPHEAHNGFGVLLPDFFTGVTTPVNTLWASNPTTHNFDPRVGFSWDPFNDGKTAVRGAFGIFDVLPLPYTYTIGDSLTLPFSLQVSANNLPAGSFPTGALSLIGFTPANAGARYVEQHPNRSYAMNWNFNIQRELAPNVTLTLGYVGSHTLHEDVTMDDANMVVPTQIAGRVVFPFPAGSGTRANPNVGFIRPVNFDGSASYNGLQAGLKKVYGHGFQAEASYAYSKCIDTGSGAQLGDPFQNSLTSLIYFSKIARRGPCDFDLRQNFVLNYLWDIPGPKAGAASWLGNGWEVGGIVTVSTGVPFTPIMSGDPLGQNSSDPIDFVDRVPNCNPYTGKVNAYLNLACFSVPIKPANLNIQCTPFPSGPANSCMNLFGDVGRNELVGPGLTDFDFSVFKNNHIPKISETFNLQLRFEFFNIFNHPNFQAPIDNEVLFTGAGASVNGAGAIDSLTTSARQIQLGAKIIW